tara:strand:+ start:1352 stop:1498 length:147 start_codon:yes stop_codon:yes gene_type:complete
MGRTRATGRYRLSTGKPDRRLPMSFKHLRITPPAASLLIVDKARSKGT